MNAVSKPALRAGTRARVTAAEVAALAEVSQSAVSRAFTPGASVAPGTRARVLDAARALGYRPNAIARSLISGRSRMIGLLAAYLDNQFYPIVLERLARALQARGHHTLLFMTDPGDRDSELEKLLDYQVDGVVLTSATLSSRLARECRDAAIPVVLFNRDVPDGQASCVASDNRDGGRQVARFLVDAGHERIAYVAGAENASTDREREEGFVAALAECGRTLHARAVGGYTRDGAVAATRELMASGAPPDALFVANDHMAFAVIDTLRGALGLRVPEDVAVVGFDDVPQAAGTGYSLTTVRQPIDPMVEATIGTLFAQIDGGTIGATDLRLPVELVVRGSARGRALSSRARSPRPGTPSA